MRFWILLASAGVVGAEDLERLSWMAGSWRAETGPAQIEEHWIPPSGGAMFGISRTVVGGKTVAFEFLRLEARQNGIVYIAHPNARPGTEFVMTELSGESAVFENPEHDHPKIIRYRRNADGTLSAEIEGDEKGERVRQEFHFQPIVP